ncbi:DMT family transporter [Mesorhizobium sp.]|uniref:DMT family transporter n=1 Tax=Mesorhizobium sp. TaxID=1871066 RepID=UPI000FE660A5|nr:DMT family transporter [Mesorhizobium sp.]RWB66301.1 MAG: DMT family transporter [Mesorhizobium sp.]
MRWQTTKFSPIQSGALFMAVSQAAFTVTDIFTKIVVESLGLGQLILVRGAIATILMAIFVWRTRQFSDIKSLINPFVLIRLIGEIGGTVFYLLALAHLPIANVAALYQTLPLMITVGAAIFLGEFVGPRRCLAAGAGFIGVLVMLRPGLGGFNANALYMPVSVVFYATRELATRRLPTAIPSGLVSFLSAMALAICGGLMVPMTGGWMELTVPATLMLAAAATSMLLGNFFIILSTRLGDLSFVAPFRYTGLIWSLLAGMIFFASFPDLPMVFGAAIVVGSGIYTLYRERVAGHTRPISEMSGLSET